MASNDDIRAPSTQQPPTAAVQPTGRSDSPAAQRSRHAGKVDAGESGTLDIQQTNGDLKSDTPIGSTLAPESARGVEHNETKAPSDMGGTGIDDTDTPKEEAKAEGAQPGNIGVTGASSDADEAETLKPPGDAPEKPVRSKGKTALIMFGLCMATFLAALDTTIITTALPTIASALDASAADYTWVGSAYLLAAAASTPSWGKISDIWGRKPIIMVANVVFFIGSIICAVAININMLLAGRVIQGIGGGGLISLTQICISDLFSMRERGMYFGMIGGVWALASALGPVLGGIFTQLVTWRWCFYVNLPCDGAAFLALLFFLDVETPKTPFKQGVKAIDWLGSLAIIGGTVMLLLGLEFGGITFPWKSATVICLIIFGVATIALFFVIEAFFPKYPIIPLRIFSSRNNLASLAVCFVHGFVFISASYFIPLYFQTVLGASPLLSGVYTFPFVIPLSIASIITGIFIRKTGKYLWCIWFGLFFMTLGFGLYINFQSYASWPRIILFQIVTGIGVGPLFQSPLIALQSKVHPRDIASATATFGFTRNMGTAISVVVGGVIFQNQLAKYIAGSSLPADVVGRVASGDAGANTGYIASLPDAEHQAINGFYTLALRDLWIFYTCFAFVGLGVSFLLAQNNLSKSHEVTKTGLEEQEKHRLEQERLKKERRASKMSAGNRQSMLDPRASEDKLNEKETV